MNVKRGQISIFILISLVILIAFSFIIYLNSSEKAEVEISKIVSIEPIELFVNLCLNEIAEKGVYVIGLQGGYYDGDSLNEENPVVKIPYYWYEQEDKMPSKEIIQEELTEYVELNLLSCIDDFKSLKEQGYTFTVGEIEAESLISEEDVIVTINFPIEAISGNNVFNLNEFSTQINFDFNEKYNLVKQIMEEQKKTPNSVPISFISQLAYNNEFTFTNTYLDNDTVYYALIFEREIKPPFVYGFLSQYDWNQFK